MIEEGKTYHTRGGRIVGPMIVDDEGDYTQNGCSQVWRPDGKVWCEVGDESNEYIDFTNTTTTPTTDQYIRILETLAGDDIVTTARNIHEALQDAS